MKKYKILTQYSKGSKIKDHDYNAIVDDNKISLIYTKNAWSDRIKGQPAATLENSGNDLTIKIDDLAHFIVLDYQQAYQMLCLLQMDNLEWKNKIKEFGKTVKRF